MNAHRLIPVLALTLCLATVAQAQTTPTIMNYQGRLTDNTPQQNPVDAMLPMEFRIYDMPVGGTLEWSEVWGSVSVTGGIFSVLLGSNGAPISASVFDASPRYLEIWIDGEMLDPRQQLGSVGFAQQAETSAGVECVGCVDSTDILDGSITGTEVDANTLTASNIAANAIGASELQNSGNFTVASISGGGAGLTGLNAANISSGTLPDVRLSSNVGRRDQDNVWNAPTNFFHGDVLIGTDVPSAKLHVVLNDSKVAEILATGLSQGSGLVFVGQSTTFGGGIAYDGDGNPDIVGGTDRVTLFRRNAGVDSEVMSYSYSSDQVDFSGNVDMSGSVNVAGESTVQGAQYLDDDAGGYSRFYFTNEGALNWQMFGNASSWRVYEHDQGRYIYLFDTAGTRIRDLQLVVTTRTDSVAAVVSNTSPACLTNEYRTGGGCRCSTGSLEKSYPSGTNAWYCECSTSATIDAHSVCIRSEAP